VISRTTLVESTSKVQTVRTLITECNNLRNVNVHHGAMFLHFQIVRWRGTGLVAEFVASRSQTIADLAFGPDGCTILTIPKDRQVTKVSGLEPRFP